MNLNNEVYLYLHCLEHLVVDKLAYHLYVFTVRRICESETFRFLPFTACSTLEQGFRKFADLEPNAPYIFFTIKQTPVKQFPITVVFQRKQWCEIRIS